MAKEKRVSLTMTALLIVLAVIGTSAALTILSTLGMYVSLFEQSYQPSDFNVTSLSTVFLGRNRVVITLELRNIDSEHHYANVTVQLLNTAGNMLMEQVSDTGNVSAGETFSDMFSFTYGAIVLSLDKILIIVKQSS